MGRLLAEEERASPYVILDELGRADAFFIFDRVGPEDVTKEPLPRRLLEPLQVLEVGDGFELGRKAAMECKKFVIDEA